MMEIKFKAESCPPSWCPLAKREKAEMKLAKGKGAEMIEAVKGAQVKEANGKGVTREGCCHGCEFVRYQANGGEIEKEWNFCSSDKVELLCSYPNS